MNKQKKHMKSIKKIEKRVLNINKSDFDIIKEYCNKNTLNMSKWITKKILEIIKKGEL